jgi:hypothetical protein
MGFGEFLSSNIFICAMNVAVASAGAKRHAALMPGDHH